MKLVRRIFHDIRKGDNLDAYVTVAVAALLSGLSLAGIAPPGGLSSVILAVLALLAVGTLITRARLDELSNSTNRLRLPQFASEFGSEYHAALAGDGNLYLQGVSLNATITEYIHAIERRLRLGSDVRILLIKPMSAAINLAEDRMGVPADYERRNFQSQASLDHLGRLASKYESKLQIRLTEQELSFGAAMMRGGTSQAVIYLQYYAYGGTAHAMYLVVRSTDGGWFDFHLDQIEALWRDAQVWRPLVANAAEKATG